MRETVAITLCIIGGGIFVCTAVIGAFVGLEALKPILLSFPVWGRVFVFAAIGLAVMGAGFAIAPKDRERG